MKTMTAVLICLSVMLFGGMAQAVTVDFESIPIGVYSQLTFPDFTLVYTGGVQQFDVLDASPGWPISGNALNSSFQNGYTSAPFLVTFNIGNVKSFQIGVGDYNADIDNSYLEVFDAGWNSLGKVYYQNPSWKNGGDLMTISSNTPIKYAKFWDEEPYAGAVFWDMLTYETSGPQVPEPLTILLLGAGLVGIAGLKRKVQG